MRTVCNMKKFLSLLLLTALAACSQRYEVDLPLALNRTEMRFGSSGNAYYVLVYSDGPWTAKLDKEVPWVSLSRTSGEGNAQIMVSTALNTGVSRGVTLIVTNSHGSREMYISQEKGKAEGGSYRFFKESVDLLRTASPGRISAGTDLDDDTIAGVLKEVIYATEGEDWIHDLEVSSNRVCFRVDENTGGALRSATVQLTFPLARWDTPVTAFFQVNQSVSEGVEATVDILPVSGQALSWSEEDSFTLLDADGTTTMPASISTVSAASATVLFNGDAVRSGIFGAVSPEDYVSRWNGGKVYVTLPDEQEYRTSLSSAADLVLLAGKKEGERIVFRSACSLLRVKVAGQGTLRSLRVSAGVPLAGDGAIDMGLEQPAYAPATGASESIGVLLPGQGVSLPAEFYLAVPTGNLGRLTVHANTSAWSGSVTSSSESVGLVHDIVPLEEVSLTLPSDATNLCEGGKYANCFLVEDPSEKMYSIDVRKPDGSVPAGNPGGCSLLWQTSPNVLTYLALDAAAGKLYFRKGENLPGSALVAVTDAAGTVCWSWHIWAPATPVEPRKFGSFTVMDRNLGAVDANVSDFSGRAIGMHYQWGRKDPFPPSAETKASGNGNHGRVYPDAITFVTAQDGVSQEMADATPTTYYWGSGASGNQDWRAPQDDALWASPTSPANPCPNGWTVASNDVFSLIAARLAAASYVERVGISIKDDDGASVLFVPGGYYRRTASTSSELANMGDGYIWSASVLEDATPAGSWRLWFQSKAANRRVDKSYPQRRWGCNVRCVKVQ